MVNIFGFQETDPEYGHETRSIPILPVHQYVFPVQADMHYYFIFSAQNEIKLVGSTNQYLSLIRVK